MAGATCPRPLPQPSGRAALSWSGPAHFPDRRPARWLHESAGTVGRCAPLGRSLLSSAVLALLVSGVVLVRGPQHVPVHFGVDGASDRWGDASTLLALDVAMVVGGTVLFASVAWLVRVLPDDLVNLPHKEYWLAPERRRDAERKVAVWADTMGTAVNLLMLALTLVSARAATQPQPTGPTPVFAVLVVAFVAVTAWSVVRLYPLLPPSRRRRDRVAIRPWPDVDGGRCRCRRTAWVTWTATRTSRPGREWHDSHRDRPSSGHPAGARAGDAQPAHRRGDLPRATVDVGGETESVSCSPTSAGLQRSVGFRIPEGELSCVAGIGAGLWDRLFDGAPARRAAPVRALGRRRAPRALDPRRPVLPPPRARLDLCFELATPSPAGWRRRRVVDEVHGFKYFDERDLLGFVDGTENPVATEARRPRSWSTRTPRRGRQLRRRPEVPARPRGLERHAGRGAGAGHRPDQARRHRAARRPQAAQLARRAEHDRRRRRRRARRSCATTCPSVASARGEFGTYFIGYAARPTSPSGCCATCSSVARPATTTGSSTSRPRSPVRCSSSPPRTSSRRDPPPRRRVA